MSWHAIWPRSFRPPDSCSTIQCFGGHGAPEPGVVIAHGRGRVVERRWRGPQERTRPGTALEFVPAWLGLGRAPLPDVAAHVEHAVRADSALVGVHGGCAAHAVLANVALGRRGLVSPRVDGAPGAASGLLPLLTGGQRLPGPRGIRGGVIPGNEDHGMVPAVGGRPPVLPGLGRSVPGGGDEARVFVVGHGVDIDVEAWQPDGLVARPRLEDAPVDLGHGPAVDRVADMAFTNRLGGAVLRRHE